jgi:SAM-dependent methyltransferase
VHELRQLHGDAADSVAGRLALARDLEEQLAEARGSEISDLDILDIGAGQLLTQLVYFARRNRVVGVDTDVIAIGISPAQYVRMLRRNGLERTLKTVGRKVLGVDKRHHAELLRVLGLAKMPRVDVRALTAEEIDFADSSFDVVYALVVFQHLARPEEVLRQMVRVLRPGGLLYLDFILYTSQTGSHDLRPPELAPSLPLWAHLRPEYRDLVSESAYLNRMRLGEWRELFDRVVPGAEMTGKQADPDRVRDEAERLQRQGELLDYDMEELCTTKVAVLWRKPETISA